MDEADVVTMHLFSESITNQGYGYLLEDSTQDYLTFRMMFSELLRNPFSSNYEPLFRLIEANHEFSRFLTTLCAMTYIIPDEIPGVTTLPWRTHLSVISTNLLLFLIETLANCKSCLSSYGDITQ